MTAALPLPCDEAEARSDQQSGGEGSRGILLATVLGSSLTFVDGSIVNVALPAMQAEFATDAAGVQCIVNAYLLPLSALVLIGGALGDHFGRKRIFMLGLALFTLATVGCVFAPGLALLLGARFTQGIGAALLTPNSLAILADTFSGEARGKAVGTWAAAGAVAGAAAPPLGGFIVDTLSWRWAFAVVLPLAAACWLIGSRSIRDSRETRQDRAPLDLAGAASATLALAVLVYALIQAAQDGFADRAVLASAAGGAALLAAFLWTERHKRMRAMVPLKIFAARSFAGISLLTLLLYGALGGLMVVLPYLLIGSMGYSATEAGAAILPFPLVMGLLSRTIGGAAARIGLRRMLTLGPLIVGVGFALFALLGGPQVSYWRGILPGLLVMALGMAISVAPLTTAVMNAVDNAFIGVASGVNNAIARTAGLIATALLGFVLGDLRQQGERAFAAFAMTSWIAAGLAVLSAVAAFAMIREDEVSGRRAAP